jgi:hypothetical protein
MMLTTPIFLVGAERSGTTLLRLMLDSHPQIAFHHEFEFAVDQIKDNSLDWPDLGGYHEYLSLHRIFLHSQFMIDNSLSYPELVNSFLLQKQQHDNKPIVGATVHYHFHQLLRIWPNAKFIHLIRDGRDVARSTIIMGWAGNMFTAVDRWVEAEQLWDKLRKQLSPEQHCSIKYESLILNPDEVLTQLCDFIGVPFERTMYDYVKHSTYSLPQPHLVKQWRNHLSDLEIQLAECQISHLLEERDYPLSGLPLLPVTPWLRLRMQIQDRWARILFRIRRYSLRLYLADVLSRRLNWQNWQKQVQLEINACDNRYMK